MSSVDNINHFAAMRVRVVGSGNLKSTIYSLDDTLSKDLVDISMAPTSPREPFRIINFVTQKGRIKFSCTASGEYFKINKIVLWIKPIATQYPA